MENELQLFIVTLELLHGNDRRFLFAKDRNEAIILVHQEYNKQLWKDGTQSFETIPIKKGFIDKSHYLEHYDKNIDH